MVEEQEIDVVECMAAIQWSHNILGAAYWTNNQLFLLSRQPCFEDQVDSMICSLRMSINPTCILLHSRTDPLVINAVEKELEILNQCYIETRPVMEFKFDKGKQEIGDLEISDSTVKKSALESLLEVETNKVSVGCSGALISSVSSKYGSVIASSVQLFSLSDRMQISEDSLYALHIFDTVYHPNAQCMKPREGTSLFSQLNKTKTRQGQEKLKEWFLSPLQSVDKIVERQDIDLSSQLQAALAKISNIPPLLKRLRVKSLVSDWKKTNAFLVQGLKIMGLMSKATLDTQLFLEIDFDESQIENRVVIKPCIDLDLDEMKRVYFGLDDFLSHVAQRLILPDECSIYSVVYFPQLGFLIKMPSNQPYGELELQFSADEFSYYKNSVMEDLNTEIGDIHSNIVEKELELVQEIKDALLQNTADLLYFSNLVANLDCLLSLASVAIVNRYICPRMTLENCLIMEKMRHPVLEHQRDRFVTNDIRLGKFQENSHSTGILITGPNASGKSVYLQEVAVIVYMAHVGSFVPCSSAVIGITDKILTRVRTRSSVSKNQSTFLIDLNQANAAVTQSTPKSLVILDEFGKGTSPSDGIALFASILRYLSEKYVKIIAATHFYEILTLTEMGSLENLSLFTMSIHSEESSGETSFLYQLVEGRCPSSLGINCAQLAGIDSKILDRARQIADAVEKGQAIPSLHPIQQEYEDASRLINLFLSLDLKTCDIEADLGRHVRRCFSN